MNKTKSIGKKEMPANLNEFENKVMDYLIKRKTAATVKQICTFFIRSKSHVTGTLRELEKKGLITVIREGSICLYKVKE